jgi:hypothetical protein
LISVKNLKTLLIASLLASLLAACAGEKVVPTKDPTKKLDDARRLLHSPSNGASTERLIWDAIDSFSESNNELGRAQGFLAYSEFLNSPAVTASENYFRKHGFLDKSVTLDNRGEKSVEYLDKAAPLLFKEKRYDLLTTASTERGVALMNLGKRDDACASFDQSVSFHDEQMRREPAAKPAVPEGYGSWKEYLSRLQKWAGCGS